MRDAIDISFGDFHPFLNAMDQGVLITDAVGHIIFCNDYHRKMDGLDKKDIIGKKVLDVYDLDIQSSPLMRVLQTRKALHNITHIYEAKNGKFVNSITNAFPIIKNEKLMGAISFVKEYEYLDGLLSTVDGSHKRSLVVSATRFSFKDIIGKAPLLRKTINKAKMAANSLSPIMLFGKTGTGKELFAQSIHNYSHRRKKNYMAVNCAAIPETLLEGILFGSTKGAFTGAMEKPGLFEQANGGTIFLDEINSMPIGLQGKLLRVLQEKKVRRVGAQHEIPLDLKVISSTNRHPAKAIEDGNLRRDLFYRIGVVFLTIPSLKDRAEDMGALMEHFIKKYNQLMDKNVTRISDRILSFFKNYDWPGNVREFENVIEGAMNMVGEHKTIRSHHLTADFEIYEKEEKPEDINSFLKETEIDYKEPGSEHDSIPIINKETIEKALLSGMGNVSKTADILGISRQKLHREIKKFHIDRKQIQADIEIQTINAGLKAENGHISRAARRIGISRQLLNYKIQKYKIKKEHFAD